MSIDQFSKLLYSVTGAYYEVEEYFCMPRGKFLPIFNLDANNLSKQRHVGIQIMLGHKI